MDYSGEKPLVSVALITYNSSKYVISSLDSIFSQSYQNIELVISDDCSNDETVLICKEWLNTNKERFFNVKFSNTEFNKGISGNKNNAIKYCQGDWIKFLAGDDLLFPDCISNYIKIITKIGYENIDMLHSNIVKFKEDEIINGNILNSDFSKFRFNNKNLSNREKYNIALRYSHYNSPTQLIKTNIVRNMEYPFNEEYPFYDDKPFLLKMLKLDYKIKFININCVKYRLSDSSVQKKGKNNLIFTQFQLQKDQFILNHVINEVTLFEKVILLYLIYFRKLMNSNWMNRKTSFNWIFYRLFTKYPEKLLYNKQRKYYL